MGKLTQTADFDSRAMASGRVIDASQWLSDEPILGLIRESGYVWGTVRDDDGQAYSYMRRMPLSTDPNAGVADGHIKSLGGKLIVLAEGPEGLTIDKTPKWAVDSSHLERGGDGDAMLISSLPEGTARAMRLRMSSTAVEYVEDGVLEFSGSIAVPGMQWYLPGPQSALLYLTQTWEVSGTVLGRGVRGFLFYEEAYMYPGSRLYVTKDPQHDAC